MPGREFTITHPEKGERVVGPEQTGLLTEALAKGWKISSDIEIANPEKGVRTVKPGQEDLLSTALAKGWALDAGDDAAPVETPEPPKYVPGDPDGPDQKPPADAYDMRQDVQPTEPPALLPTPEERNLLAALNRDERAAKDTPGVSSDAGLLGAAAESVLTGKAWGPGADSGAVPRLCRETK